MIIDIVTLFPEMFEGPLDESIVKRARQAGVVDIRLHDLREWTRDKHRKADDEMFGGGAGLVMKAEPLFLCHDELLARARAHRPGAPKPLVVLTSPQGQLLDQALARRLSVELEHLVVICGHYKGVDERFVEGCVDLELSIGDYVLSGGELPAMVLVDALVRLLPGAIGSAESAETDSLEDGLLDAPVYTRPASVRGREVPDVLLSGHHARIEAWRLEQRQERTRRKRPDLWKRKMPDEG
ncbi:MAG: tRNA (guanosine(37)-N1)-methyltransferase TrmD [Candidatus Delongbacteria bacterium]